MRRKFKKIFATMSATTMLFTVASVPPEKSREYRGITANAEGSAEQNEADVASVTIGGKTLYYATMKEAFESADGKTAVITLLHDVTETETLKIMNENSDITLDCGGFTLTCSGWYGIEFCGKNLTIKNGTIKYTGKQAAIYLGFTSDKDKITLNIMPDAVIESVARGISGTQKATANIYGTVLGNDYAINTYSCNLNVYPGAVISGEEAGIIVIGGIDQSTVNLYGGTIIGKNNNAINIDAGATPTINIADNMTAKLDDVVLTSPITESTTNGTIIFMCKDAHSFDNTALDENDCLFCDTCQQKIKAVAKVEKDGNVTYADENGLDSVLADSSNDGATITLLSDVERTNSLIIKINCTLDLNQHTIHTTGDYETGIWNYGWTNVTIKGEGEVISDNSHALIVGGIVTLEGGTFTGNGKNYCGVYVNSSDAELYVNGENVTIQNTSGDIGLGVNAVKSVQLTAGTIRTIKIAYYDKLVTLGDLLGNTESTRYAYFDGNTPITDKLGEESLTGTVTVKACDHSAETYTDNNDGTHKKVCHACDKIEDEAHNTANVAEKSPTCVDNGNIEYWYCSKCETYFSDEACTSAITLDDTIVLATGHSLQKTSEVKPTCTEDGHIEYWHCSECGKYFSDEACTSEITLEDTVVVAMGHSLQKTSEVKPTCTENGNIEYWHCSECEKYFSDEACTSEITLEDTVVKATGHDYDNGKCKNCGVFEDGIGTLSGASLSLSGNIGVNFFMELDESIIADENAYIQFTLPNGDTPKVMVSDANKKDGYYVFSCEVSAKEMNGKITAQVITSNGEGTVYDYSVQKYIDSVSENQSNFDEKTINLVNAMANYGDYSKAYFGGEALEATPEMDNITADTLTGYEKQENGVLPSGITYYGSSLILESNTTLRHYFKVANGTDVSGYNFSGNKGNYYYVDIADISAGTLFNIFTTTVGDYTIEYSPMTYVQAVLNNDSADEALKNTVKALYLYGQSAQAYKN